MKPGITEYISYEVKKEIADRYFGFRKLIEDDKLNLAERIKQHSYILEKRICFDLLRLYILLKTDELINSFLDLAAIDAQLFYDSLLPRSPNIKERVLANVRFRGLTRTGRFVKFGLDCYERLVLHVEQYGEQLKLLHRRRDTINEESKLFYRKNDITAIMSFLHAMANPSLSQGLQGGMEVGMIENFEKKMRIEPLFPIEQHLPSSPPLIPLAQIRSRLKKLLKRAYKMHDTDRLAIFAFSFSSQTENDRKKSKEDRKTKQKNQRDDKK